MSKMKGPDNPILRKLVRRLRKKAKELDAGIWSDLAEKLNSSNRSRAEVNVSQLDRHTDEGDTVVVPGKVLGSGKLGHSVSVAAFDFSSRALDRIRDAGGKTLTINELLEDNPEGTGVKIME